MKDYLSIWRLIPKVSVGLAFSVEVVFAVGGVQGLSNTIQTVQQFFTGFKSELVAIVVSVFLLTTILLLGFQLSRILLSAFDTIAGNVIKFFIRNHKESNSILVDLVAPISDIARRTYQDNSEYYMTHYALKSAANEKLDKVKEITAHFEKVQKHVEAIRNWELICVQAYQESLSQDQRKLENMESELAVDTSLYAVLIGAFPVMLIRMWTLGCGLAIGIGVTLLLLGIAGMFSYTNRKRRFARFQLASYLDVFTVAEMAEYSEHEGEPKI
jgi:hypothetical protein